MGLINQFFRNVNEKLSSLWDGIVHHEGRRNKKRRLEEHDEVPKAWRRPETAGPRVYEKPVPDKYQRIQHRFRIPGLLMFKRILAGFLCFVNFVISQYVLGISKGGVAQGMFIFFLFNAFICADYLWKTRKK
jgi:hypothetical protein